MTGKRKLICNANPTLQEVLTGIIVIPTLGYKEARDAPNQVRRGSGFWSVIAIPAPDGRSATSAVRSGEDTSRGGKGRDSKGSTNKGKGSKRGKGGKSSFTGESDPSETAACVLNAVSFVWRRRSLGGRLLPS